MYEAISSVFHSEHYMLGKLADKGFYSAWHKANFALMV